jgi:hypothetical protein
VRKRFTSANSLKADTWYILGKPHKTSGKRLFPGELNQTKNEAKPELNPHT